MKLEHILVPVDFSASTHRALAYAAALRTKYPTVRITLMHVVTPHHVVGPEAAFGYVQLEAAQVKAAETQLKEMAITLASSLADRFPEAVVCKVGRPWEEICLWAEANEVDLIIMPTHGLTGLKHAWLGSVAERVVQKADCTVLVVRSEIS
jgi:nucleotide-binding universal stress UspA family protein